MYLILPLLFLIASASADLPTNYEYYTSDGINSGLSTNQSYFLLNGKNITILSGTLHYFRVPRSYWRDRLRKMRAAGLNTVETYIPWNLHEYKNGFYDFGNGESEMSDFLHLDEFLQLAQEEDLFAIVRPGPYICAEFEFGGFPSWLLREPDIVLRTSDPIYTKYVTRYFNILIPILSKYQFSQHGPIIMFQVENEFAAGGRNGNKPDLEHLKELRQIMIDNGIAELLATSDNAKDRGSIGTIPGVFFQTSNFNKDPEGEFDALNKLQDNMPSMAMEFWSGWFDDWGTAHNTFDVEDFKDIYERILAYPGSANIYVFVGSTNFGFTSGAGIRNKLDDNSGFSPVTTSYDYDAPISENGDYTKKYYAVRDLIAKYNPIQTKLPDPPALIDRVAYPNITIDSISYFSDFIETIDPIISENITFMEDLPINDDSGQNQGYIVYRKRGLFLSANSVLKIGGHVCDSVIVLVNDILVSPMLTKSSDLGKFGYWKLNNSELELNIIDESDVKLDIIVENWGRTNGHSYNQFKGIWQDSIYLNNARLTNWEIFPLEFKKSWITKLSTWLHSTTNFGPNLYKANLTIEGEPRDTYLDMREWRKGLVIVNNFVLGRYATIGPQQTLYLPAPFLQTGTNEIIVFEHFVSPGKISFLTKPVYKTV